MFKKSIVLTPKLLNSLTPLKKSPLPMWVFLEFIPCLHQLLFAGNDEFVVFVRVVAVILYVLDIFQEIEANGITAGSKQSLRIAIVLILLGKP